MGPTVLQLQGKSFGLGPHPHQRDHVAEDGQGRDGQVFHLDLAGLDLRQVEDVVHEAQEVVAVALDRLHGLLLFGPIDGVGEDIGVSQDRGHGGADLVAHIGQEFTLAYGWRPRRGGWTLPTRGSTSAIAAA